MKQSAKNPRTWAPLLGAGLVQIDDMDNKISKWAYRENPIFNSKDNADDWSDAGQTVSWATSQLTLLLVDEPWKARGKDWLVMIGAREVTSGFTSGLKNLSSRSRPLDQNEESFPSGHTSRTATAGIMGQYNLRRAGHEKWAPVFDVMLGITAWGRVEAGKHHPSDVLVGWSLGHFVGETAAIAFFQDPETTSFDVSLSSELTYLGVSKRF